MSSTTTLSWYVGAPGYWLWTFTDATTTVYVVDPHRSHEIPLRILGADFAGMLVSDCLASYDPLPYKTTYTATQVRWDNWTISLNKVTGGNARTSDVDPADFPS